LIWLIAGGGELVMSRRQKESNPLAATAVRGWIWRTQALGAALAAGAMMLIASAAAAYSVCPAPTGTPPIGTITQCCRITKPGNYAVNANLTSTGGACIKIMTSGVVLDGHGLSISGNGTGIGIRLLPAAAGDVVFSFYPITNFKTGILDDAPGSVLSGFESSPGNDGVSGNAENGIVIRANRVSLLISTANSNGGNGVVVEPLAPATMVSNVYLSGVYADRNTKAGFLLDSLSTFTAYVSLTNSNGTDGADLINSVNSTITDGHSNSNTGDGVRVVGGHSDIVNDEVLIGNAIGLEVRSSAFDTIDDDTINSNTGDGLLMVNGKGENITDGESDINGGNGIHLKRTTSSRVHEVNANVNNGAGIWLDGSHGISVQGILSYSNVKSDVYIGCSSAQEPDGTTCASLGLPASNGNRVVDGYFDSSSDYPKPDFGIGIDTGNHHNQVLSNIVKGDTTDDLVDENTNCDSNLWMFNAFTTASPTCIH
jgi:Periplasmic copper-binding protein (NosD)